MSASLGPTVRIATSKTAVPELPADFFPRPALREELDRVDPVKVIAIIAPAGYGKTLLLADWVRAGGRPTAWVALDGDDNEPRRLWAAVLTALRGLPEVPEDSPLRRSDLQGPDASDSELVDQLTEGLDRLGGPVRLVLDDVQDLTGAESLRGLARLVRRRPAGVQLVLASRSDPPISLPRLRLEGRLHGVRADRLMFSLDDTAALLQASGVGLSAAQVALLHARTEGWVAGLRLAALALRRSDDPDGFLAEFSGDEHSVADYLTGEVLEGLPGGARNFLTEVSVCSPLPAALAIELSGRPDADHLLDQLGNDTALVERTAPGVHRLHALLRSYLCASLERNRPDRFRLLQARAARWWAAQDERVHAFRHAVRSGDRVLLVNLLHRWGVSLLLQGDVEPLRTALEAVTAGEDPWLALLAVITHLEQRAVPAAATRLQQTGNAWPAAPSRELEALRAASELRAVAAGLDVGRPAPVSDDGLPSDLRALLHASRGTAELVDLANGGPDRARGEFERALDLARAHDFALLEVQSLTLLAAVAAMLGDHRRMVAVARNAVAAAARHGRHPSPWSAGAVGLLAYAALLSGAPADAAAQAGAALREAGHLQPEQLFVLHSVHGAAVADLGDRPAGLAEVQAARAAFDDTAATPWLSVAMAVLEHRLTLLHGNPRAADDVARWLDKRTPGVAELLLLTAWAEVTTGRLSAARAAVGRLRGSLDRALLPTTTVELLLLEAESALQAGDEEAGRRLLVDALARGEAVGVLRPFALTGPCVGQLLDAGQPGVDEGLAARVAAARAAVDSVPAPVLTERETAVLELLPSLLTAAEIADEFTVSVNTVKSHIRSVYAKLGVSNRREAVDLAARRGLLR
ncbi:MAG TPA: LuxR C-terminal-related transcriptional regulator [Blastococcus sp.]|jgi:LuxR family maltose regulon positive regulatory protein|nr:LuxR C-terminal-related transcriptional regulator [Blastococcus sp.]